MSFKNKKIVITGGNGFLGKHLVNLLRSEGFVSVVSIRSRNYNLAREEDVKKMFNDWSPDIVIHLAAKVGGIGANKKNPGKFFYDNLMMGSHVIEQSRIHNVEKLVMVGTICSYPKFTPVPFKEEDIWKGYPEETNAPYGIAKKALLAQCQAYREQYGLNAIYLLPVNLYGPGDNFDLETSHVIPAIINKINTAVEKEENQIICWGTGKPTREFLFVKDAADAVVKATENYDKGEPVNIGSGQEISIFDLVNKISGLMNFNERVMFDHTKPDGQPRRCLDVTKAKKEFNFEATTSLADGLQKTINWYYDRKK